MFGQIALYIFVAAWVFQLYFYLRYMLTAVMRTKSRDARPDQQGTVPDTPAPDAPGVTVIVCAKNEEANLRDYLQALLTQDYPTYEVIVVNDGSVDNTALFLEFWEKRYRNLRFTFVPASARVASTKKLAITLGAKAAQYDYLLLTDADCRPESTHWITEMMSGFSGQGTSGNQGTVSVVLGMGVYFYKRGMLNRLIQFDTLFNGLQYLGMAASGHPYMGVGRNLAYSKDLFFDKGGFHGLMEYRAGDDDLFVNRVATRQNTNVVCTRDSLTWSVPKTSWRDWFRQKRRHLSVAPHYRFATKLQLLLEPLSRGLLYGALIALITWVASGQSVEWVSGEWLLVIVCAAMVLRWVGQCAILNTAAARWGTTKMFLLIPLWEILLPLITLIMMLIEPLRPKSKRW